MKKFVLCILTVCLTTPILHTTPPTFSQRHNCCWVASWVQLVYNLRPAVDLMLNTNPKLFSDYEAFKKTAIGKELAQERTTVGKFDSSVGENVDVEVSVLETRKDDFENATVEKVTKYLSLFKTIRSGKVPQIDLDMALEALQRALREEFGIMNTLAGLTPAARFIGHPLLTNLITHAIALDASPSVSIVDGLAKMVANIGPYEKLAPILVIYNFYTEKGLKLNPFFSIDLAPLASEKLKNSGQCLQYDLTGMVINLADTHWIAFIKDQYDPAEPWWRCDTLSGNRQVTEQEILTECAQHAPNHLTYKAKDCQGQSGVGQSEIQDNRDVELLAQALWKLGE